MPITVACACGQSYPVREEFAGQHVQCPACGQMLTIPTPATQKKRTTRAAGTKVEKAETVDDVVDVVPVDDAGEAEEVEDIDEVEETPRRGSGMTWIVVSGLFLMLLLCGGGGALVVAVIVLKSDADPTVVQGTQPSVPSPSPSPPPPLPPPAPPPPPPMPPPLPPLPNLPPASSLAFDGHQAPIAAVAFTRDGRSALSAAGGSENVADIPTLLPDNTLRVWDAVTGKEEQRARNFRDGIGAAAFSPDGRYAVLAGAGRWEDGVWSPNADGVLHVWDLQKDQEVCVLRGHTKRVFSLAFSPDGTRILSGGADHSVRLWNVEAASEIYRLPGHTGTVTSIAFSPDGNYGLSGSADMTVRLWDLRRGAEQRQFPGHKDIVWAVAFSPAGKYAASGGGMQKDPSGGGLIDGARDFDIRIWDVETGAEVRRCRGNSQAILCLAFSRDGRRVLSGGADKSVHLWQVATGKLFASFTESKDVSRAVDFFPDGHRALIGGDDRMLRAWDLPPDLPEVLKTLDDPDTKVRTKAVGDLTGFGPEVRPSIPALIKAMERDDPAFRTAMLAVLAKAGPPARTDAAVLAPLLMDRAFPGGRIYALESLVALGADYPDTLPALKAALNDTDKTVKRRAVQLAGQLGAVAREALFPPLLETLSDTNADVSKDAAESLAKMGKAKVEDLPQLNEMLLSPKSGVRRYALLAVTDMGRDAATAVPRLTSVVVSDREPELRRLGLVGLSKVQTDKRELTKALKSALRDADPGVKKQAVACLGDLAPEAEAVDALLAALSDPSAEVAQAAEELLPKIKFDQLNAKALAAALNTSKNEAVRLRLMETLVVLKPNYSEVGQAFGAFLKEAKAATRPKIIAAIGDLGNGGADAGPALVEFLKDDDRALRFEVALTLCKIRSDLATKAVPQLVSALRLENPNDKEHQEKANKALVQLGKPAVDALAKSLGSEFFGGDPRKADGALKANARRAVIVTLDAIGADAKDAIKALGDDEKEDPDLVNRAMAKETRLKIQRLAAGQ